MEGEKLQFFYKSQNVLPATVLANGQYNKSRIKIANVLLQTDDWVFQQM